MKPGPNEGVANDFNLHPVLLFLPNMQVIWGKTRRESVLVMYRKRVAS